MLVREFFQGLPRGYGQICVVLVFFTKSTSDPQEERCSPVGLSWSSTKVRRSGGISRAGVLLGGFCIPLNSAKEAIEAS